MATIEIRHPHGCDLPDARDKAQAMVQAFCDERPELVGDLRWSADGNVGTATGRGFKGKFRVTAAAVEVDIDLAMLARPFKSRVEAGLRKRLQQTYG